MAETQRVLVRAEVEDKAGDVCTQGREPTSKEECVLNKARRQCCNSQSAQWDDHQKPL